MLNKNANLKLRISVITLLAFYISGIIGILTNNQTIDFLSLTPLNLLINAAVLLANHQFATAKHWFVCMGVAIAGFFVEVIGVNTGFPFGNYVYQTTLGWKFLGTPLIIGVNWMLLSVAVVYTVGVKISNTIAVALASACLLVLLDILIEPVAVKYHFWSWEHSIIPVKNYVAWFVISFVFCYIVTYFKGASKNNVAPYLLTLQFIFFGIFNFMIWK